MTPKTLLASTRPVAAAMAIALAALLGACADRLAPGFGEIVGGRYHKTPIDTYAVTILRIDGRDWVTRPAYVDPGLRRVTVQGPPDGAGRTDLERTIDLQVTPCTRYYLVAVKGNRLDSNFTVKVDFEEPIGGCKPPAAS